MLTETRERRERDVVRGLLYVASDWPLVASSKFVRVGYLTKFQRDCGKESWIDARKWVAAPNDLRDLASWATYLKSFLIEEDIRNKGSQRGFSPVCYYQHLSTLGKCETSVT